MGSTESKQNSVIDEAGYRKIKIQDLPPVADTYNYPYDPKKNWKQLKCTHSKGCECKVLTYIENIDGTTYAHSNSFLGAFLKAYNNHGDIILSPDDVWMVICFQFSKYINNNSEQLRDKFVDFKGKKKLTVTTGDETDESQWNEFFNSMIEQIKKNTKEGIVDILASNFSTTGVIEKLISIATVMDSFKNYFDYGRFIPMCGINNVRFMGTLNDWNSLLKKMLSLKKYSIAPKNEWEKYINELEPIINKFIDTFNGNVDVDFWNKIMNLEHGSLGSGSTTYISGWIIKFFGYYHSVEVDDIKSYNIDVPVHIQNFLTNQNKTVNIVGGFGGVNKQKIDGSICYRPQLSMIVYHGETTQGQ